MLALQEEALVRWLLRGEWELGGWRDEQHILYQRNNNVK